MVLREDLALAVGAGGMRLAQSRAVSRLGGL